MLKRTFQTHLFGNESLLMIIKARRSVNPFMYSALVETSLRKRDQKAILERERERERETLYKT